MKGLSTAAIRFSTFISLEAAVPIVVLSLFGGKATSERGSGLGRVHLRGAVEPREVDEADGCRKVDVAALASC